MNPSAIFIRRSVATTLLMLGLLLFGVLGYQALPVSDLPNVDFPTLQVSASLPGAGPETMAAAVATPLEKQFSTIAGLDSMSSSSSLGSTQITLQFDLSRDIDAAAQDVQAAISTAARRLPQEMPGPPSFRKVNPADQPIFFIALTSPTLPLSEINEYAETRLAQQISTLSGVAQVNIFGAQKYAVRVQLDPQALATRGISLDEVATALQRANVNMPSGTLQGQHRAFTLQSEGQLERAPLYRPLIVAYRNGSPVRLEQLGRVIDSVENDRNAAWYITREQASRAMVLAVQKQPGSNTVAVADSIRELLPKLQANLPASVQMNILSDRSASIRESVRDVKFTLGLTIALVIMVIFLFLRNVTATIIPSLALPLSLIGTFAVMYLCGYSVDNLSLMALTLSVGFVVDDAIVMLENIVRHMEQGKSPLQAAMDGSKEISFTIISMTISLAAVFIPLLFMGGILGRLFHEFAVTISAAILLSGAISLTLTPMLAARILRPEREQRHGRFYRATEALFDRSRNFYGATLAWTLRHHRLGMVASAALLAGAVYLYGIIPKGFIPNEDTGRVTGQVEAAQDVSFPVMVRHQMAVAEILRNDPNVEAFMARAGGGGGANNSGFFFIRLKDREHRKLSADEFIQRMRPKLATLTGVRVFLQNPPPIRLGGRLSRSSYQYTLQGTDTAELYRAAGALADKMQELPGFQDVTTDMELRTPQVVVDIDRDRATALGVSVRAIEETLYNAYGSRQVSTIYAATSDYQVMMEVAPEFQRDPGALSLLYVRGTNDRLVQLESVATLRRTVGPLSVNHAGQLPAVTISFNLQPGLFLSDATARVDALARETLPGGVTASFQGTAQAFQSSLQGLGLLLMAAILVIYIVLGVLYESYLHPLTILSGIPAAGVGALATLLLFGMDLNIYAFVGVIMLVGLVKKNGIMMVDFAIEARRTGASARDAIHEACLVRFRPIMMTTMAALMGTLPIALGVGAGAEARRPLGLAVVGGLIVSQFLTLYLTPVFYLYMEKLRDLARGKPAASPEERPTTRIQWADEPVGVGKD